MNKKFNLKVVFILIIIIGLTLIVYPKLNKKKNVSVFENHKESSNYAIYLQDVSGNYSISNSNTFPTSGYILNVSKTECYDFSNSKVSDIPITQELNGKITLTSDKTVYCNLYFTKDDNKPVINNFTITGKAASNKVLSDKFAYTQDINVTYDLSWNDEDVAYYCITSGDSASCNWVEAANTKSVTVSTPALDNNEGNKTMKAYLKDKAQNISEPVSKNIFLDLKDPTVTNVTYKSKDTSSITVKVEGTDGSTGSGIIKYECSAKEKGVWYTQDTNGNCKVTDLSDNTSYTIEGRVTDASGRVSTNSVSTSQSTEAAYSCSEGEELVQDAQKGSSSGGYICKASASSKEWSKEETYYTCSADLSYEYSKQTEAENACKGSTRRSCSSVSEPICSCSKGELSGSVCVQTGTYELPGKGDGVYVNDDCTDISWSSKPGYHWGGYYNDGNCCVGSNCVGYDVWFCDDGRIRYMIQSVNYATMIDESPIKGGSCLYAEAARCTAQTKYRCPIDGMKYTSESGCNQNCLETTSLGSVLSHSKTTYFCLSGWSAYSGSGNSLECYRPATKG